MTVTDHVVRTADAARWSQQVVASVAGRYGEQDAQDATQDAWVSLLERMRRGQQVDNPGGLLHRMSRHRAWELWQHRRRMVAHEPWSLDLERHADARGHLESMVDSRSVLRSLPPHEARLIYERYWRGASQGDLAEVLGVPETTVTNRVTSMMARLRRRLGGSSQSPERADECVREDLAATAKSMRGSGLSYARIAKSLGCDVSWAWRMVNDQNGNSRRRQTGRPRGGATRGASR